MLDGTGAHSSADSVGRQQSGLANKGRENATDKEDCSQAEIELNDLGTQNAPKVLLSDTSTKQSPGSPLESPDYLPFLTSPVLSKEEAAVASLQAAAKSIAPAFQAEAMSEDEYKHEAHDSAAVPPAQPSLEPPSIPAQLNGSSGLLPEEGRIFAVDISGPAQPEESSYQGPPDGSTPAAGDVLTTPHTGCRAAEDGTLPHGQEHIQAEMIQVWLDVPGGVGSVVPLIREGAKNWMSSKQLRSLLLPDIIYSTFQNRVSQETEHRAANTEERRFLTSSGVLTAFSSRATLLSVTAACNILRRKPEHAAKISALQKLEQSAALTPAQLDALPVIAASPGPTPRRQSGLKEGLQDLPQTASEPQPKQDHMPGWQHSAAAPGETVRRLLSSASKLQLKQDTASALAQPVQNSPQSASKLQSRRSIASTPAGAVHKMLQSACKQQSASQPLSMRDLRKQLGSQKMAPKQSYNIKQPAWDEADPFADLEGDDVAVHTPSEAAPCKTPPECARQSAETDEDTIGTQWPTKAAPCRSPPHPAKLPVKRNLKMEWSPHPSDTEQQELVPSQGEEVDSRSQPSQVRSEKPSQTGPGPSIPAGLPDAEKGSESSAAAAANVRSLHHSASQAVRDALCGHQPRKRKDHQAVACDTVNAPSDAQPMSPAAPGKEAAEQEHCGKADSMVSGEPIMARVRRAARLEHFSKSSLQKRKADASATPVKSDPKKAATAAATPTKKQQLGKLQHNEKKKTYQAKAAAQATGTALSREKIQARIAKLPLLPYGMTSEDCPPVPKAVDNPEDVAEQEDLMESIYSRNVHDEYLRRREEAKEKSKWCHGVISESFLAKIIGESPEETEALRDRVVDQIVLWLSLSPQQRKQWMAERLEVIKLDDFNHPAFARFKAVYEPLELRDKERALRFKKAMAAWKLLGEYTGVWDNHETVSQRINDDPIGLGTMRRDKVTEFASTSKDANEEAQKALRVGWSMSLEIDPSRAHNQLCLINDFRNVPGNDRCNVVWLEVEDSRTLQPHLFHFTACGVKAGQEALLDYGEEYHRAMEDDLRRATFMVAELRKRENAEASLNEARIEHQAKERQMHEQAVKVHATMRKGEEENARLNAQLEEVQARSKQLEQQLAQQRKQEGSTTQRVRCADALPNQRSLRGAFADTPSPPNNLDPSPAHARLEAQGRSTQACIADLEKQLKHKETSCNRITQERNSARKALLELSNVKEAKAKELKTQLEARDRDLMALKEASNIELQQKESALQEAKEAYQLACNQAKALQQKLNNKQKELESTVLLYSGPKGVRQTEGKQSDSPHLVQEAEEAYQLACDQAEALEQELNDKQKELDCIVLLWQDTREKSEAVIEGQRNALATRDEESLADRLLLANLARMVPAGLSLNDIAELSKSTPLQIVPLKRQPEAQSPLPKDLSPVTLRLAMEPHQSDTELPSADAQLPGTPDTHVDKVRSAGPPKSGQAVHSSGKRKWPDSRGDPSDIRPFTAKQHRLSRDAGGRPSKLRHGAEGRTHSSDDHVHGPEDSLRARPPGGRTSEQDIAELGYGSAAVTEGLGHSQDRQLQDHDKAACSRAAVEGFHQQLLADKADNRAGAAAAEASQAGKAARETPQQPLEEWEYMPASADDAFPVTSPVISHHAGAISQGNDRGKPAARRDPRRQSSNSKRWPQSRGASRSSAQIASAERAAGTEGTAWAVEEEAGQLADLDASGQQRDWREDKPTQQPARHQDNGRNGKRKSREQDASRDALPASAEKASQDEDLGPTHRPRQSSSEEPCSICGRFNHSTEACRFRQDPWPDGANGCHLCGTYSHIDAECLYLLNPSIPCPDRCRRCHKIGHGEKTCRQKVRAA